MKAQTAFRLDESLLGLLRERAKKENRSLNNLVETILKKSVQNPEQSFDFKSARERSIAGNELKKNLLEYIDNLPWKE